ncbi:MAG: transcriptional repressor [Prevotella sp.]|nr:transcriptional repressor [Prevotella sp.]
MNKNDSVRLLELHDIKPTANRIVVVNALMECERPMSLSELEYKILTIDKSGIFRTLTLFKEHHLVHVIEDGGEGVRYELCHSHNHKHDDDVHVHFFCEHCHKTYCFENIKIPQVDLPDGYEMTTVNYVIKGRCPECKK